MEDGYQKVRISKAIKYLTKSIPMQINVHELNRTWMFPIPFIFSCLVFSHCHLHRPGRNAPGTSALTRRGGWARARWRRTRRNTAPMVSCTMPLLLDWDDVDDSQEGQLLNLAKVSIRYLLTVARCMNVSGRLCWPCSNLFTKYCFQVAQRIQTALKC